MDVGGDEDDGPSEAVLVARQNGISVFFNFLNDVTGYMSVLRVFLR